MMFYVKLKLIVIYFENMNVEMMEIGQIYANLLIVMKDIFLIFFI